MFEKHKCNARNIKLSPQKFVSNLIFIPEWTHGFVIGFNKKSGLENLSSDLLH